MKTHLFGWLISVINSLFITFVCNAQNPPENSINDIIENLSVNNDVDNFNYEEIIQELSNKLHEPVNLNSATREQLSIFPFLNDQQIENLLAYVYIHEQMKSIYELQLVEGMDKRTIELLRPFVCVKVVNNTSLFRWKTMLINNWKYKKQEVLTRIDIPFYSRYGYQHTYLGTPVYNSIKYSFHSGNTLYAGLVAEKDPGEPFGALHNKKGYDFYSIHLLIHDLGRLKTLAIGDYKLSFGEGLVIGNQSFIKTNVSSNLLVNNNCGIRKHSSTDEFNFFRGVGITFSISDHLSLSGFYSSRHLDAVLEDGKIKSISNTGFHRSSKEVNKIGLCTSKLTGSNMSYQQGSLRLGITGIYYFLNHPYEPDIRSYSKYSIRGNHFYNYGLNYSYRWGGKFYFHGETSVGKKGLASLNSVHFIPVDDYQFVLIHRYYSYDYWGMYAHSFSAGSNVSNENGWYLAANFTPIRKWHFGGSLDLYSCPWLKYRVSKPSKGVEGLLEADFSPKKEIKIYAFYRYKQKERDVLHSSNRVTLPTFQHNFRLRLNYDLLSFLLLRSTFDYNHFHFKYNKGSQGVQFTQMASLTFPSFPVQVIGQGSYFLTDDYDSRVYIYERGLFYTFYTPCFQGKGFRMSATVRYDMNKHWMFLLKIAETVYLDRNKIGTGDDLIVGNKKADLQVQVRFKF